MSRNKILSFTKTYYDKHGGSPSIRAIADGVDGVDSDSFYQYFKDKDELLVALGIKEEVVKPEAAMEAKKSAKKTGDYLVTLNRTQSEKLIAIAYMEGKTTSMVVDEILEEQRQVREIMFEVNEGTLDSETIDAILHPNFIYRGHNISRISNKPWFLLNCNRCRTPILLSEELNSARWLLETLPAIKSVLSITCSDCYPNSHSHLIIPVR